MTIEISYFPLRHFSSRESFFFSQVNFCSYVFQVVFGKVLLCLFEEFRVAEES